MTEPAMAIERDDIDPPAGPGTMAPLPGEPGIPGVERRTRRSWSKKGLLAVALLALLLIAGATFTILKVAASGKKPGDAEARLAGNQPAAASIEPRRLDMPAAMPQGAASASATPAAEPPRIPALVPTADETVEPIGVRTTGHGAPGAGGTAAARPEDAPVVLVSSRPDLAGAGNAGARRTDAAAPGADPADPNDPLTETRRNLEAYQRQLQGLMDNMTRGATAAAGQSSGLSSLATPPNGGTLSGATSPTTGSLFGGQLQGSATPRVAAGMLGNRSLTLPKGTAFTCALKTKVVSAVSGFVGCQVQRNVFSDDGRVLLIERGSHMDGEYRIGSVRPGMVRIPVLWTRIRTPHGVTVDIESPGTGPLGESGIDGYVDNRWGERIGAAMLLSLIDDSVKLIVQHQTSDSNANTIVLPSTTANTSKLAEKVLDSTINIPPLIYQNQGGIVGIYVARDVDFSSVYELKPTAGTAAP